MLYSLSRFRFERPSPPLDLGGEFVTREGQHYLADAQGLIALEGPLSLWRDLNPGDLVVVRVEECFPQRVKVSDLRREVQAKASGFNLAPRPHAARFAAFSARVRRFFTESGLQEIATPSLVPCPGLEPSLEPFATTATWGRREQKLYLPTSPEIHLKKAMAAGWLDIFEIKSCFRRGEFSEHHANEFTMLEWYRGFAGLELIEADLRRLLAVLSEEGWAEGLPPAAQTTDFATLFRRHLDFELKPSTSANELLELCAKHGVYTSAGDTLSDLFHRLLIDRIEPAMARTGPLIVKRFPPSQAALAKLDGDGWADRFEFYWNGLEIANAFNEVCDPQEQRRRWDGEQAERARLGTTALPQDEALIQALGKGLPPSGGIALGVERLYMAFTGVKDIRELKLFSTNDFFKE